MATTTTTTANIMLALTAAAVSLISLSECRLDPISASQCGLNSIPLIYNQNQFSYEIKFSNPEFTYNAIFSTADELTQVPCSTKAKPIPCSDPRCQSFPEKDCNMATKKASCSFGQSFLDGSSASGNISTETAAPFGRMVVGCVAQKFSSPPPLVGFAASPISIPGQLRSTKFSYCLSNNSSSYGKLRLREAAMVADGVSLPLRPNNAKPSFLFLGVDSMIVGTNTNNMEIGNTGGRMLISTGTPLTKLPSNTLYQLEYFVKNSIGKRVNAMKDGPMDLCYEIVGADGAVPDFFPDITLKSKKWRNSVVVKVPKESAFVVLNGKISCLAVAEAPDDAILGVLWQRGMTVLVNTQANTATFTNTGPSCV